jgi:hypothetical protein
MYYLGTMREEELLGSSLGDRAAQATEGGRGRAGPLGGCRGLELAGGPELQAGLYKALGDESAWEE